MPKVLSLACGEGFQRKEVSDECYWPKGGRGCLSASLLIYLSFYPIVYPSICGCFFTYLYVYLHWGGLAGRTGWLGPEHSTEKYLYRTWVNHESHTDHMGVSIFQENSQSLHQEDSGSGRMPPAPDPASTRLILGSS